MKLLTAYTARKAREVSARKNFWVQGPTALVAWSACRFDLRLFQCRAACTHARVGCSIHGEGAAAFLVFFPGAAVARIVPADFRPSPAERFIFRHCRRIEHSSWSKILVYLTNEQCHSCKQLLPLLIRHRILIPKSGVKLAIFMQICPKNEHLPRRLVQQSVKAMKPASASEELQAINWPANTLGG